MASGCIIGECPVCGDLIYEDEWTIMNNISVHDRCKDIFIANKLNSTKGQVRILRRQEEIKRDIEYLKSSMEKTFLYYKNEIERLEKLLEER